ncbi:MAG: hypothetical protein OEY79_02315, partial [Anaplasmataceae bacterium]|nr:hypothetical protein [Anaplasmataceae bacterium]
DVMIEENNLKILKSNEKIHNYEGNIIFDFGGYIDTRIVDALEQSDCVIVPTLPEMPDIQGCIDTINTIKQYNSNVIVVINRFLNDDTLDIIQKALKDQYTIRCLNQSKAFPNIYKYKKSILDMAAANPLLKFGYRKVLNQFDEILKSINDDKM